MNKEIILLLVVAAVIAWIVVRRTSTLPARQVRAHLDAGAVVVDVRTPEEFAARHLSGAVNVPLQSLRTGIARQVPDKSTILLLHCQSGSRSGVAQKQLRAMGYTNAFNIGSYHRAKRMTAPESSP